MNMIFTHITALIIYRILRPQYYNLWRDKLIYVPNLKLAPRYNKTSLDKIFNTLALDSLNASIDILFKQKCSRYKLGKYKIHTSSMQYPSNSFCKFNESAYLPCPELLFYQLSNCLDDVDLMLAGYELCGLYTMPVDNNSGFINDVTPLTNPAKLLKYLNRLKMVDTKCDGINKAIKIAEQIKANSNSPQESRLSIMLSSNRAFGGFGISDIQLNKVIKISKAAQKICLQKTITPDLSIPNNKIAIEYDSSQFHDNVAQNQQDKLRSDALYHDGWKVFTFVKTNTHNFQSMQQLALDVLKANGQNTRFTSRSFCEKRIALYNKLYNNVWW